MKVPSVFTSSFPLFLSFFSLEGSSMTRTKNKNAYVSNSYLTLCLLCKLLKICWLIDWFIYRSKDMFTLIRILSRMVMPLYQSPFCELWSTVSIDIGQFYRTKESHVLLEVIHIYVNQYMNLTKATSGTPLKC